MEARHGLQQRPVEELLVQSADFARMTSPRSNELANRILSETKRPAESA
jgi:hypothetical protein